VRTLLLVLLLTMGLLAGNASMTVEARIVPGGGLAVVAPGPAAVLAASILPEAEPTVESRSLPAPHYRGAPPGGCVKLRFPSTEVLNRQIVARPGRTPQRAEDRPGPHPEFT
jgi:hypothetical protein